MDKHFHDLLQRYINGNCTPKEVERINRWYREIADPAMELEEEEKKLIRGRMLTNIVKTLPSAHKASSSGRMLNFPPLLKVAAAIALIAACAVWYYAPKGLLPSPELAQIPKMDEVVLENQTGTTATYNLSDGSRVELEPGGRISFPRHFLPGKREVHLSGKAFFDIARDPLRPFYVYSRKVATRVLGTSFFVNAPPHGGKVEVKVVTGKVSVFEIGAAESSTDGKATLKHSAANGVVLSPNQKVEYFIEEGHWVTGLVDDPVPVKSIDTHKLSFVFANTPMKEVLRDINERYGIEVITENERISQCTFTGDVSKMALYDMLDVISNSIGSTYEVKGTRILISGKGCVGTPEMTKE